MLRTAFWMLLGYGWALVLASPGCSGQGDQVEYEREPMPEVPVESYQDQVQEMMGAPGQARPLPLLELPQHPFLAPTGRAGMHGDAYGSGTHPAAGPLGRAPVVRSAKMGEIAGECAAVTFDSAGRMITVCSDFFEMALYAMDPDDLGVFAKHVLPLRESNSGGNIQEIMDDTSGGAYFHLDNLDRPIVANAKRVIQRFVLEPEGTRLRWRVEAEWDLNPFLPEGARVTTAIPDWEGRLWFVTRLGVVGVVDPVSGDVQTMQLDGEEIQNAFAVASDGVYIVSDHAMYRFQADESGAPEHTWREVYDRGSAPKPGAINQGSGTTPTLLGDDLVAISDNADSRVNVLVYHRLDGHVGDRLVCQVPVFEPELSVTDNSFVGYGDSIIVENNFGYDGPFGDRTLSQPGILRIDVAPDRSGCEVVWQSDERSPTTVPKLSLGNGLIYFYTFEIPQEHSSWEAWYLMALDFETGETVFKVLTGTGYQWNNNYAPVTIGPSGTAYVGCFGGIMAISDGA